MTHLTAASGAFDRFGLPVLLRVWPDDRIEVAQRRYQQQAQAETIAAGYVVGRPDASGDYVPLGMDPTTGEWRDVRPGDVVIVQGRSYRQTEWSDEAGDGGDDRVSGGVDL